jgi:hypothetical protein
MAEREWVVSPSSIDVPVFEILREHGARAPQSRDRILRSISDFTSRSNPSADLSEANGGGVNEQLST